MRLNLPVETNKLAYIVKRVGMLARNNAGKARKRYAIHGKLALRPFWIKRPASCRPRPLCAYGREMKNEPLNPERWCQCCEYG